MIRFVPYAPSHLAMITIQPGQGLGGPMLGGHYAEALLDGGMTESGVDPQGRILGCAGFMPQGPSRAEAWAILSVAVTPRHFLAVHRHVLTRLESALERWQRLDALVDPLYANSVAWVARLGFTAEVRHPCWWPGGRAALRCYRLRDGISAGQQAPAVQIRSAA